MRCCLPIVLFILIPFYHRAQEYPRKEVDLERLADELFGFQDLDLNYEDLYENLAMLLASPKNINSVTEEELRFLNLLTEEQLQNFLHYRSTQGILLSIYELQAIPDFDLQTIYTLTPFFIVEDPSKGIDASMLKRMVDDGDNYAILRYEKLLQTKRGFTELVSADQHFRGSDHKLYMRVRSSRPGEYSLGVTVEKDAGEQMVWNPSEKQYGFDYLSFHAQVLNKGKIKNLILGDYQSQFGQGLLLGSNFGFGKGGETITTIRRSNLGFMPYTSINETGYLRGIALTYEIHRNLNLSGFYSNAWRDATLAIDPEDDIFASALQNTGLHRNASELSRRKTIHEQQHGFILNYRNQRLDAGIIFNQITYDKPIIRNPQPYNQFSFSGINLSTIGSYLNYNFKNFTFFSEVGKSSSGGYGLTTGILGSVTPQLDVALHYRHYQKDFYSLYSNAFAESSLPQNERGMYWGWKYQWNRKYSMAGYADLFRFPWLRYRGYSPSDGHELLFRFTYQPSRQVLLFAQVREESKIRNVSIQESNLYPTDTGKKRNFWINCDYGAGQRWRFKSRAQFSTFSFNGQTTSGMILVQDISINFGKLSATARYALFGTDDYDNRQYVYERDMWLVYSMPALSGNGLRNYILLQYNATRKMTFWIRYSHTRFTDQESIGSGPDTIDGDTRNDIKLQVRVRF